MYQGRISGGGGGSFSGIWTLANLRYYIMIFFFRPNNHKTFYRRLWRQCILILKWIERQPNAIFSSNFPKSGQKLIFWPVLFFVKIMSFYYPEISRKINLVDQKKVGKFFKKFSKIPPRQNPGSAPGLYDLS